MRTNHTGFDQPHPDVTATNHLTRIVRGELIKLRNLRSTT